MLRKLITWLVILPLFWAFAQQSSSVSATKSNPVAALNIYQLPDGVSIHQLDNGLKVLLIENPALPMSGVNVVVKVGSAYETFATSGMSHMLEHLLFNGTTERTQKELYDDVDRIGGYNNAHTGDYFTNFMMVTPAEHMRKGMEIQAGMLFNSVLPLDKFEKEKGIVLEEIAKSLDKPQEQLERNIISILFEGHALSLPTVGTYATIESMSRDEVYDFYKNYYVPNNMILSAIGNFQSDSMLTMIEEIYGVASPGMVQRSQTSHWATGFQKPQKNGYNTDSVYHRFYDGDDSKLQLFYRLPSISLPEYFELLDMALERQVDSLQSILKDQFPHTVKSLSFSTKPTPLHDYLQVSVNLKAEKELDRLAEAIHTHIQKLRINFSEVTVKAEAIKARTDFLKNIEKPHMFGIYNAQHLAIEGIESVLSGYSGAGYYEAAKKLEQLKLTGQPLVIVQHSGSGQQAAQVEKSIQTKLFEDAQSGVTVIAKQNKASELLTIHYLFKHKAMYELEYGKHAAQILQDCFGQRLEAPQQQERSNQFGLTYKFNDNPYIPMDNIYLHPDFGYIRAEGLADDIAGAIQFLNEQLQGFKPTQEEFEKAKAKFQRLGHSMGSQSAQRVFEQTYDSLVYESKKYPEPDKELTYENLLNFAEEYFHPSNILISAVSPISPDSLNGLLAQLGRNTESLYDTEPTAYDRGFKMPAQPIKVVKEGGGEQSHLFWGFIREIAPQDKAALNGLSLILSDRIVFDIREKQGRAYRMSAGVKTKENKALFYIRMATRPQNVDKLIPQFPDFFKPKFIQSLTADELEKSINMYLGRMKFRRLSSINQAYYLAHSYYFHGDIHYDRNFLEQLKTVTVEDMQRVAEKYLEATNPILAVVR